MSLKAYKPETEAVKLGKSGAFNVRGMSTRDISKLLREHMEDIELMFGIYENMSAAGSDSAFVDRVIGHLITEMPLLATKIIVIASDEGEFDEEALANVEKLPLPIQMDALLKVMKLTFEEVGGVKKFMQTVMTMLAGMGLRRLNMKDLNALVAAHRNPGP